MHGREWNKLCNILFKKKGGESACYWDATDVVCGREVGTMKGSTFPMNIYVDDGWRWSQGWNIGDADG